MWGIEDFGGAAARHGRAAAPGLGRRRGRRPRRRLTSPSNKAERAQLSGALTKGAWPSI